MGQAGSRRFQSGLGASNDDLFEIIPENSLTLFRRWAFKPMTWVEQELPNPVLGLNGTWFHFCDVGALLGIGMLTLADGSSAKGFICKSCGLNGAEEITSWGGWSAWLPRSEAG